MLTSQPGCGSITDLKKIESCTGSVLRDSCEKWKRKADGFCRLGELKLSLWMHLVAFISIDKQGLELTTVPEKVNERKKAADVLTGIFHHCF